MSYLWYGVCLFTTNHQKIVIMINVVKTYLLGFALILLVLSSVKANEHTPAYIEQYKTIVVNEMSRVGIPASIKMAQAILESGSGRSTLAKQSNNHFGIKCGSKWTGEEVYRHDDDYKDGLLVRSCFRAYDDPAKSFMAHSDFLLDNRRYAFLFDLDIYDYKGWANGLRKAGYATDPNYPSKLINLIEKYELYLLDLGIDMTEEDAIAAVDHEEITNSKRKSSSSDEQDMEIPQPVVIATNRPKKQGRSGVRKGNAQRDGYYTFKQGDQMSAVAAQHNMDVKELYFRNRLPYGAIPKAGEQLAITKYIHFKKKPATEDPAVQFFNEDYLFEETITISSL